MVLSSRVAAKYRGVLPDRRPLCRFATFPPIAGESAPRGRGAAPLSADNTPPKNPFILVPVTLRNRSVTVRVDGDGISHIGAYTLKHRHFRHASSRFRLDQLQVNLSSSVRAAVMVANIVFFPQPLGIDIQLHRQLVRLHINPQE